MITMSQIQTSNDGEENSTIVIYVTHPAHVHFYKHAIKKLQELGHAVHVFATDKEITLDLLHAYDIEYSLIDTPSLLDPLNVGTQLQLDYTLYRTTSHHSADVITSIGGTAAAHVSAVTDTTSVVFYDTEHATIQNKITYPFADIICTPKCYQDNIGENQIRYPGYHELAYLHPNRFEPDPRILDEANLERDERFVILRLVSWGAAHDVGDSGFDDVSDVVEALESTGATVRITSEAELPGAVEDRQISIPPHKIHNLMAFAELYIGESATMATESAVLGTPAIFVSSSRRGYTDELEDEYGLVFNFSDKQRNKSGINKAVNILESEDSGTWNDLREAMLEDKIDTTSFILKMIQEAA
ncbi:hypothetical protein DJ84_23585 [Halorubrum ezzemoulense]|nr:hypothetical protein DJ84_23585 [Halorubrum ezzemoulense]